MTAHLSADGRNHEPQCTMVDAAYVPAESILRDLFQFIQVGFASIEKSRVMQYSVHVLPYYPKNADAIVAHYLPYCPTFYTRQRCRRGGGLGCG